MDSRTEKGDKGQIRPWRKCTETNGENGETDINEGNFEMTKVKKT